MKAASFKPKPSSEAFPNTAVSCCHVNHLHTLFNLHNKHECIFCYYNKQKMNPKMKFTQFSPIAQMQLINQDTFGVFLSLCCKVTQLTNKKTDTFIASSLALCPNCKHMKCTLSIFTGKPERSTCPVSSAN